MIVTIIKFYYYSYYKIRLWGVKLEIKKL